MGGLLWLWSVGFVVEVALSTREVGITYVPTKRGWEWWHEREGQPVAPVFGKFQPEACAPRAPIEDAPTRVHDYGDLPELHADLGDL